MRVPIGWLRDYVDIDASTDDTARRLAMLGFPVETIERRPALSGVLAGRIVTLEKHPNADRLSVCILDVGGPRDLTIATAATNVATGQIVPVATVGATLVRDGQPLLIEPRKMRGVESEGMLCSAEELGLEAEWFEDGIMQLDADIAPGLDVVRHFRLDDDVLEVEVTANRVDAMSLVGIARELGASLGVPVRDPVPYTRVPTASATDATSEGFRVSIESPDCRRFVAQCFTNVRVHPAPAWMRVRLALAGQRPINNLVDISNFVMLEIGQPQHDYDIDRLAGRRLIVRDARAGESIRTLDGEDRALDARALVIADEQRPQCLAGLRGAAASEVTATTREIVVESACFVGPRIRRMGVAYGLRTDASARHERGLTLAMPDVGAARAAALLVADGATAQPAFAVGAAADPPHPIELTEQRIRSLIGIDVSSLEIDRALSALGFQVERDRDSAQVGNEFDVALRVVPPYWRGDVTIDADVAEEVARVVGYDRVEAASTPVYEQSVSSADYLHERAVAHALAAGGYREVLTLALQPRSIYERFVTAGVALASEPIEIVNPLSEDQRYLRFSLVPGMLALAAKYQHAAPLRFFELGHVFEANPGGDPFEIAMTAWLLVVPAVDEPPWRDSGFATFKGEAMALMRAIVGRDPDAVTASAPGLHPGKTASIVVDGKDVATIGALDPRLCAAWDIGRSVYVGLMRTHDVPAYRTPVYRAPSRYPAVERDIALVIDPEIPVHEIEHAIRSAGDDTIAGVSVFDEYRGPQIATGRKSIAVRIRFQRRDGTLTDAEVDAVLATIVGGLEDRFGAHIRT